MKKILLLGLMGLMGLSGSRAHGQMIIDMWNMTTGVDTTLWYDIDGVDSVIITPGNKTSARSGLVNIGFPFTLGESTYSQFSTNINGTVRLGSTQLSANGSYSNALNQNNGPKIEPFGYRGRFDNNCYTRMALLGTAGNRVLVVETRMKDYSYFSDSLYVSFQVQLFEAGGLRVVYGEADSGAVYTTTSARLQNGVSAGVSSSNKDIIFIDFATHEAVRLNASCSLHNTAAAWPEKGRWYRLAYDSTLCPYPPAVTATATNLANVSLQNPDGGTLHVVIPARGIDTLWTGTTLNLGGGFNPATTYQGTVQTVCGSDTSLRSRSFSFTTGCGPVVHLPWVSEFSNYSLGCWDASQYSYYNYRWEGSNGYAVASSLTSSGTNTHYDEWLVSPVVNLPNVDGLVMKFKYSSEALHGVSPTMDVRVAPCTAAGVVDTADWTTVMTLTGVYSNYIERRIFLDTWRGQTVKVAFVRTGLGGNCVYLDRVELLQELEPVFTLTAPTHARTGESVTLTAQRVTGVTTGLTYTWHSSLMDSTTVTTAPVLTMTYTAGGTDTMMVIASNAYGADTAIVIVTVHDCTARPVPYIEDFDGEEATTEWETAGSMPSCWIIKTSDASATTLPHIVSSYQYISAVTNNALLMMAGDPSQHGVCEMEMVAMPYINEPLTNLQLAFDYCFESSRCVLEVGYYNSYLDVFTVVDTVTPHTGSYIRDTVSFLGVTANNVHIALRWSHSTSYWGVAIDNIEVLDTPVPQISIESPSIAYVYDTVDFTAHLLHGDTTGLTYSWQSTMVDNGVAQMVATDSVLHVLYTVPGTDTIKLTTVNAYGSRIDWVYVQVSDCNRRAIPYFDDFESVPVGVVDDLYTPREPGHLPECWESRWTGHEYLSPRGYGLTYYLDGTRVDTKVLVLEAGTNNNSSTVTYVVLPGFEYDINELSVAFDYFLLRYLEPQYNGIFSVGYMVDTVFTPVRNLTFFEHLPFRRDTIRFHDVTIPNARIALRYQFTLFAENYAAIDNLEVFRDTTPVLPPVPDTVWRTVTLTCDSTMGVTDGGGVYPDSSMVTLSATALDGYEFTSWDDGDSSNPRLVMVVSDTSFVAIFNAVEDTTPIPVPDTVWRTVTLNCDSTMGVTDGGGVYPDSSMVTLSATALDGYEFTSWDDGDTNAVRTLLLVSDTTFTAYFAPDTMPGPQDTLWRTVTVHMLLDSGDTLFEADVVSVTGAGSYPDSTLVTLTAYYDNYYPYFWYWVTPANDTLYDNPYSFVVTSDTVINAIFGPMCVGIDGTEGAAPDVFLHPNPATGDAYVSVGVPSTVTVVDLQGRTVLQPTRVASTLCIQQGTLPKGIYFVSVSNSVGTVVKKLVIQ